MTKTETTADQVRDLRRGTLVGIAIGLCLAPPFALFATFDTFSIVSRIGAVVVAATCLAIAVNGLRLRRVDDAALLRSAANASWVQMLSLASGWLLFSAGQSLDELGVVFFSMVAMLIAHNSGRQAARAQLIKNVARSI